MSPKKDVEACTESKAIKQYIDIDGFLLGDLIVDPFCRLGLTNDAVGDRFGLTDLTGLTMISKMLDPIEPRSTAPRSTVQRIREMITRGELAPGAQLPPQRELSAQLGVSRPSLREALSVLETLGVLRTEASSGTFVAEAKPVQEQGPWSFTSRYSPDQIYQFRLVVEGYAAKLAAMRVGDADLARLREALRHHQEAIRRNDSILAAQHDFEFHRLIMEYSGNKLFVDLHESYRKALLESQYVPTKREDRGWEVIVEHENILRTFTHKDPDGANYFMHVHIARAADRVGIILSDSL